MQLSYNCLEINVLNLYQSGRCFYANRGITQQNIFGNRPFPAHSQDNKLSRQKDKGVVCRRREHFFKGVIERPTSEMLPNSRKPGKSPRGNLEPLQKVRKACEARGSSGIVRLGNTFRLFDDDGSKSLDFNEFKKGLRDYGVMLNEDEERSLYLKFDKDGSGKMSFDEFLNEVRGEISPHRQELIMQAFKLMDKTNDGFITKDDLKDVYNVKKHPKYLNGDWTEEQCLNEYLKSFEATGNVDGKITFDEWKNYYAGVSASIDNDPYFDLMMRKSYKGLEDKAPRH
ncbi:calcyphosin-like protein [Lineus longissimus]|uniref:calcyphosin-like protein n=1 Tax=Lineus longissimus TaxID=88925 RepID=UPI002B4E8B7A